jgi:hypothetical protein
MLSLYAIYTNTQLLQIAYVYFDTVEHGIWQCETYCKIKLLSGHQGFRNLQININAWGVLLTEMLRQRTQNDIGDD